MNQQFKRPTLAHTPKQYARKFFGVVFAICLLASSFGVLVWLFGREERLLFRGVVETGSENVGPVENARIVSVEVTAGSTVKAGDVLVRFDPTERLRDQALNEIKLRECEQSIARQHSDLLEARRQCGEKLQDSHVAFAERTMERARDLAELAGIEAEIKRLTSLVNQKLVSDLELSQLRPKAIALQRSVQAYEPLLQSLSNRIVHIQADYDQLQKQLKNEANDPTVVALKTSLEKYENLQQSDITVLRAVSAGVVSQVFHRPGDIVAAGEAVVRLAASQGEYFVTGMLPIDRLDSVHVGDELLISRVAAQNRSLVPVAVRGRVETIAPEVLDFFDPLGTAPRSPVRGRKIRIKILNADTSFIPGETVLIEGLP